MSESPISHEPFLSDPEPFWSGPEPVGSAGPPPPPPPPPSPPAFISPSPEPARFTRSGGRHVPVSRVEAAVAQRSVFSQTTPVSAPSSVERALDVVRGLPRLLRRAVGGYWRLWKFLFKVRLIALLIAVVVAGVAGKGIFAGGTEVNMGADGKISGIPPSTILIRVPGYAFAPRPDARDFLLSGDAWGNEIEGIIGADVRQVTNRRGRVGVVGAISAAPEYMGREKFRSELLDVYIGGVSGITIADKPAYTGVDFVDGGEITYIGSFYENQLFVVATYKERDAKRIATHILKSLP